MPEQEQFDPITLRGISVKTVFESQQGGDKKITPHTKQKFFSLEESSKTAEGEPALLYDIAKEVAEGISLRRIAEEYGVSHKLISTLLKVAHIPYLSRSEAVQRLWSDPQFRERNGASQAKVRGKYWQDPQKRESAAAKLRESALRQWEDPVFRDLVSTASSESSKKRWQDPEFRKKMNERGFTVGALMSDPEMVRRVSEARKQQWQDPEFRERNIVISRANLAGVKDTASYRQKLSERVRKRWEDPEYRSRMAEKASNNLAQLWQDPEYRALAIERSRETMTRLSNDPEFKAKSKEGRLDPANRDRMVLPTIHGFRSDIGFYAQSTWEANVARIFKLVGRDYVIGSNLRLEVTDEFRDIFNTSETTFNVDFSTISQDGRIIMYELMAHPFEDPEGWAKLEMARKQYPEVFIKPIDERYYKRLRKRFEERINNEPRLSGWEKDGYNLKTNPEIFG